MPKPHAAVLPGTGKYLAVRVERRAEYPVGMPVKRACGSGIEIPYTDGTVRAAAGKGVVRTERDAQHLFLVSIERHGLFAGLRIPETDSVVAAAAG